MLNRLDISNYALIENASIEFTNGFSSITGETGAGKSILLKALNLLLGERADTSVLRQSEQKCYLEAEFNISKLNLEDFFKENDLDFESPCLIRREFTTSGKSRCFVNDSPVQIAQLKELGEQLVNIHSQHQTLQLFDSDFQTSVLDSFSGIESEVSEYKIAYKSYRKKVNLSIELEVKERENRKEKDYLEFLLSELEAADLGNTDLQELKIQSDKIEFAEKISEGLALAKSVFENDTYGPSNGIKTLIETFEELKAFDPKYADILGRLISLKIEMDDIDAEVSGQSDDIDFSASEAMAIKEKMDLLNSLCFKHNLSEVIQLQELESKLQSELDAINSSDDQLTQLKVEIEQAKKDLTNLANSLSKKRKANADKLCQSVAAILSDLAMADAEIQVEFQPLDKLGIHGLDQIQFLAKTNKGGQFSPLKKVASGGELSRIMLAIMSILSESKQLPTLIFDEIDTGVSGEVASKIANEFVKMGKNIQLISITHLPQVAAKGQQHFHVSKSNSSDKTTTSVQLLTKDERIKELAKMMSGEQISDAALENASQLLVS